MEEAPKLIPKKRRRPSSESSPFAGTFTRSKSLIYVHCNRSGRARSDSFRLSEHHANLRSMPSLFSSETQFRPLKERSRRRTTRVRDVTQDSADTDDWSRVLIKDLRARRVFSPASVDDGCGLCVDGEEAKGSGKGSESFDDGFSCDAQNLKGINSDYSFDKESMKLSCLDNLKVGKNEDMVKPYIGNSCKEENINDARTNTAVIEDNGISDGHVEISSGIDDLNEECVQVTPPDAEIFGCRYENGGNKVEPLPHNMEHASQKPTTGSLQKSNGFQDNNIDKKNGNNSGHKLALSPRSRVRLFKNPGSFSYRRLLPYLMEMAKDNSCASKEGSFPTVEDEKVLMDKSNTGNASKAGLAGDSRTLSLGAPIFVNGLSDGSNSNSTSIEHVTDSSVVSGSQKDLCMGVHFPDSLVDECCSSPPMNEKNEKIKIGFSGHDEILNSKPDWSSTVDNSHFNGHSNHIKPVENDEATRTDSAFPCNFQDLHDTQHISSSPVEKRQLDQDDEISQHPCTAIVTDCINPTLSYTEGTGRPCDAEKNVDENSDLLDEIDDSNEETIQITPPDDGCGKPEVYENVDAGIKCVLQTANRVPEKPLEKSMIRNNFVGDKRTDSSPKRKLGLNSCSRLKLFQSPSSFNYRRLLPYLMDITKDNSGACGNGHCAKLEKSSEESLFSSKSSSDHQETPTEKVNGKGYHMKNNNYHSHAMKMPILAATNLASHSNQPNLMSPEPKIKPMSFGSQGKQDLQVVEVMPDEDRQSQSASDIVISIHGSSSPSTPLCSVGGPTSFSGDCLNSDPQVLSFDNEGECTASQGKLTNGATPVQANRFSLNSSQNEASDSLGIPAHGYKKSILKRNPRGCRGFCTCLNCASFCLNAERAFEFTKNQMQDAEEVALDLIKELSYMRNMLEQSAFASETACINQVKDACRKASEAEELAKNRLSQMNYDLNIHCRTPRPRVTFSNNVEERFIS